MLQAAITVVDGLTNHFPKLYSTQPYVGRENTNTCLARCVADLMNVESCKHQDDIALTSPPNGLMHGGSDCSLNDAL